MNRELLVGLAAPRAVLLQVAHPAVAAGVAQHSNFRRHFWHRLYRTSQTGADIAFGSVAKAQRAARHIHHCHQRVRGTLSEGERPFPSGTSYDANDPSLKLWVLATLIDSSLLVYDLFVKPLSEADRSEYYSESLVAARLFGIPAEIMPANHKGFSRYMEAMLAGNVLTVGETARQLVKALFAPWLMGQVAGQPAMSGSVCCRSEFGRNTIFLGTKNARGGCTGWHEPAGEFDLECRASFVSVQPRGERSAAWQ